MNKVWIILLVSITLFASCEKNDLSDIDYFAFGTAYGQCTFNCATFFKIEDKMLYPDNLNYYYGTMEFKSEPLPDEKYILAKKLIDDFPQYLLDNPNKTFGCPDCYDQGGIHIEILKKGKVIIWHIDTDITKQPEEIRAYVRELVSTVKELI